MQFMLAFGTVSVFFRKALLDAIRRNNPLNSNVNQQFITNIISDLAHKLGLADRQGRVYIYSCYNR